VWSLIGVKRQAWTMRSASAQDGAGTSRDSDDAITSGASRGHKQRRLAGTESDIMQQMLFSKPPRPRDRRREDLNMTETAKAMPVERQRVASTGAVDTTPSEKKTEKEKNADGSDDDDSNASAGHTQGWKTNPKKLGFEKNLQKLQKTNFKGF